MSRKKNEATVSEEETVPQTAEGANIPNCKSVDIRFYEGYVGMYFIPGSAGIVFKNQQNKHYGHMQAHPFHFSVMQKGKNLLKRWR